eukprot:jgi/Galph1/1729/GphlegSOOS_G418.1
MDAKFPNDTLPLSSPCDLLLGMKVLVTFDIDGTLLKGGKDANSGHKKSIEWAVAKVWGIETAVDGVKHCGLTDQIIMKNMCLKYGKREEEIWPRMKEAIRLASQYFETTCRNEVVSVLPGVEPLLQSLQQQPNTHLGVVSGNLETIGWNKLELAGLKKYFSTGAFGNDHILRGELILLAIQRWKTQYGENQVEAFHIGDTIEDLEAAKYAGVKGIGVATGIYSRSQLESCTPYLVVDDLTNMTDILQKLKQH